MSVNKAAIPGTVAQSSTGVSWSNLNNAKVEDGVTATCAVIGPGGGGGVARQLEATNFGMALPTNAVIDGIKLDIKARCDGGSTDTGMIWLLYNGGATSAANTPNIGQNWFHSGALAWQTYGGATTLWGRTWTAAEINHANFGASMAAQRNTGTGTIEVDAVIITVYYHVGGDVAATDVPTREIYKVFNSDGDYVGILPQPTAPLKLNQDINSLGNQITINVPVSADTSALPSEVYTTEDGTANYTAEDGTSNYVTETQQPIAAQATNRLDALVKNGNTVQVWLYNYWYPNGKCMFMGRMRRWEADFGDGNDTIDIVCYSLGYDLDNYFARGAPFSYANDQVQTTNNTALNITVYDKGGWNLYGQTFTVGAGVTNVGAITLLLAGTASVTVKLWSNVTGGALLAQSTIDVNVVNPSAIQFAFPNLVQTVAGTQLFFTVEVNTGGSINIYSQNTDVYSGGFAYNSNYAGGSAGGAWTAMTSDLYFITSSGTNSTTATYTSKDPSTQMLAPIITDYNLRGGKIVWTATSIDATGLSLTYTFKVQTVYEALQAVLSLAPSGFYYYIDLGTNTIYFKNAATTAEFYVVKGKHINNLKLVTTTEGAINILPFTGGETSPGVNLYTLYQSAVSIQAFGPLLERKSDNRVTVTGTADAIGNSEINDRSVEKYQTTITLAHTTDLDITLLVPGKIVGFRGFGTYVDGIISQIVRREWTAESVTLTLGVLPKRQALEQEQTQRQLIAQQTQDNPSAPS